AWASWQVTDIWRLSAGATVLRNDLRLQPDSNDPEGVDNPTLSNDPEYQRMLRSSLDLPGPSKLEVGIRYVSELPHPVVPSYRTVDVFYGWQLDNNLEISASVQNMSAYTSHIEFGAPTDSRQFERSAFLKLTWMN
ncbi:MAG TPA: hypothetical protein VGL10_05365, partial [Gammaproteobacteria bacterium]